MAADGIRKWRTVPVGGVFRVRVSGRRDQEPTGVTKVRDREGIEAQMEENYGMEPSKYKGW